MSFKRFMGWFLLCTGILTMLAAGLGIVLPSIENEQVRLILASVETVSRNPVANASNGLFSLILTHSYRILLAGATLGAVGALILWLLERGQGKRPRTHAPADPYRAFADAAQSTTYSWRRPVSPEAPAFTPGPATAAIPEDDLLGDPQPTHPQPPVPPPYARPAPASTPSSVSEQANPYRSYGQSAYAPPAERRAKPQRDASPVFNISVSVQPDEADMAPSRRPELNPSFSSVFSPEETEALGNAVVAMRTAAPSEPEARPFSGFHAPILAVRSMPEPPSAAPARTAVIASAAIGLPTMEAVEEPTPPPLPPLQPPPTPKLKTDTPAPPPLSHRQPPVAPPSKAPAFASGRIRSTMGKKNRR